MTLITTAFAQGTLAGRPAAATANSGYYYLATDQNGGTLYQSTGAAWVQLAAPAGGTFASEVAASDFKATGLTGATAASRYVGATASAAPVSGTFAVGDFVIDQTGKLWICTTAGTPGTWTQIGGGGGGTGALVVLSRQVITGSAVASVTFSSIPGTYDALWIVWTGRSTAAVSREQMNIRFNGDTGSNYYDVPLNAFGTTVSAGADAGVTGGFAGDLGGASLAAALAGRGDIRIPDYAATTFEKGYMGQSYVRTDATTGGQLVRNFGGLWASSAAITSITLYAATGNIAVGSQFTLYGLTQS